jgi:hypothetical protein
MVERLTPPVEDSPLEASIKNCEAIIEEGVADVLALRDDRPAAHPSHRGHEYDEGYAQGRKDAARVILVSLRGSEHITSDDVRRGL